MVFLFTGENCPHVSLNSFNSCELDRSQCGMAHCTFRNPSPSSRSGMQGVRFQFFFHICSGVGLGRNFVFCKCGVSFSEVTSDGIQKPIPLLHLSFLAVLQHPGREEGPLPWPLGRQTSLAKSPHWELGQGRCFRSRSPGLPYPTGLHLQCIFLTVQAPSSNRCFAGALPLAAEDLILAALISRRFDVSGSFPPPPGYSQIKPSSAWCQLSAPGRPQMKMFPSLRPRSPAGNHERANSHRMRGGVGWWHPAIQPIPGSLGPQARDTQPRLP